MLRSGRQYWAISKNAFIVALGDPVYLVLMLVMLAAMAFVSTLPTFNFGQELRLVRDQVLAMSFISGCVLAAVGAVIVVANDLRRGAVAVLMSRPVGPFSFVAGKWTGLAGAIAVLQLTATVAMLWMTRVADWELARSQNIDWRTLAIYFGSILAALGLMALKHYLFGGWYVWQANVALCGCFLLGFLLSCFLGNSGQLQHFGANVDWATAGAGVLIFLAQLLFVGILLPAAVRLDPAGLLLAALLVFGLGLLADYALATLFHPGWLRTAVGAVVPNWRAFWAADVLADRNGAGLGPHLVRMVVHVAVYVLICLVVATLIFERREYSPDDHA